MSYGRNKFCKRSWAFCLFLFSLHTFSIFQDIGQIPNRIRDDFQIFVGKKIDSNVTSRDLAKNFWDSLSLSYSLFFSIQKFASLEKFFGAAWGANGCRWVKCTWCASGGHSSRLLVANTDTREFKLDRKSFECRSSELIKRNATWARNSARTCEETCRFYSNGKIAFRK